MLYAQLEFHTATLFWCSPPCPKVSLLGTVEATGTYCTGLEANAASKDRSEQAPWRSYYGLAFPAPGTCPPRSSVSMLGRGRVQLPCPALAESLSQCRGRDLDWSAGTCALHSWVPGAGNLRGKRRGGGR